MRYVTLFLFCCIYQTVIKANDGAFYTSGNHLMPMMETRISIRKEILEFKRVKHEIIVSVYYEFFNPDVDRLLEIGFEAEGPEGDVPSFQPRKGQHPYINDFSVKINDSITPYKVSIVDRDDYFKNGIYKEVSLKNAMKNDEFGFTYRYVYHFKAKFKKGLNIVKHQYKFQASVSVMDYYGIDYVLTTAMRWANKKIDDFTLNIDLGEIQTAQISKSFFKNNDNWKFLGKGRYCDTSAYESNFEGMASFYIQNGPIQFHQTDFKTSGELHLNSPRSYLLLNYNSENFDYTKHRLPFDTELDSLGAADSFSLKVLKNLPYAFRGYIFQNGELQKYFESQAWYRKDPEYEASLSRLSSNEKNWLGKIHLSPGG